MNDSFDDFCRDQLKKIRRYTTMAVMRVHRARRDRGVRDEMDITTRGSVFGGGAGWHRRLQHSSVESGGGDGGN